MAFTRKNLGGKDSESLASLRAQGLPEKENHGKRLLTACVEAGPLELRSGPSQLKFNCTTGSTYQPHTPQTQRNP